MVHDDGVTTHVDETAKTDCDSNAVLAGRSVEQLLVCLVCVGNMQQFVGVVVGVDVRRRPPTAQLHNVCGTTKLSTRRPRFHESVEFSE